MFASEIIKRARSLADVPNSQFISYSDELESMWESYKDIYSKITDSSDDYYVSTVTLTTTSAIQLGINEWELTLPFDIYKIRFVDFQDNGAWNNMEKFNTNSRNKNSTSPKYRFRGSKLWIVGILPSLLRIDYYPAPVKPSLPEIDYTYCLSYPQYDATKISSPNFFSVKNANMTDNTDYLIYIYDSTTIRLESTVLNTLTTLYTSTGLSNVVYNLGYIYFLKGGDIWRATTNLTSTIVPVQITSVGTITGFTVSKQKLYYSDGTDTYESQLDGTSPVVAYAYDTIDMYDYNGSLVYIKVSDGHIYIDATDTGISATYVSSDGSFIYYLDSASVLHKYTPTVDVVLKTNVTYIGSPQNNFIATINDSLEVSAISTKEDTDFNYPLNESNEIMAYQCAIDFKRKQNGDVALLAARVSEIWDRFMDVLKRDEGQPERMSSQYPHWNF